MKLSSINASIALAFLGASLCLSTPAASADESVPGVLEYRQTQEAPPKNNEDTGGAEMGQATKQAKEQSTLGRFSKTQSITEVPTDGVPGMDVSSHQGTVDWARNYAAGARFAYIKATEGDYYKSNTFSAQYIGATEVGIIRGAYHFAIPAETDGATQARYFVANGGGWSADGRTLPGLLDIEYNPYTVYGNICYNMTSSQLITWISDFTETYKTLTGRYPVIYTANNWWSYCIGTTTQFSHMALHHASYNGTPGTMPNGWDTYDIWQFTDQGPFSGDSNVFNGSMSDLRSLATNASYVPKGAVSAKQAQVFRDVPVNHLFYREISWLASTKITTGWADGTFRPSENIDRDAMAAFIYRMSGSPAYTPPAVSPFKDVPVSHPFYKEISWLASQGITTGWADGTFRPNEDVTREAMAAFMYRLAGSPATSSTANFTDVTSANQFKKSIDWMAAEEITTGWADGTFRPQSAVTREAMAAFIYRFTYRG